MCKAHIDYRIWIQDVASGEQQTIITEKADAAASYYGEDMKGYSNGDSINGVAKRGQIKVNLKAGHSYAIYYRVSSNGMVMYQRYSVSDTFNQMILKGIQLLL